ncbi:MAG TPA: cyclic nucleotide-binding domain-containing protein [Acidimicrobiales bacterium]|jgi:CRP-like cAMP-binding protein|nr:cyclic nucleotide-binding domain-containing protein [Acidimicrobiales bacterium]
MAKTGTDQKVEALANVGLFTVCNQRELKEMARLCTSLSVDEGFVLATEGGSGRECFVIADGTALVTIGGEPVGVVGPGECVGEMALLDRGPRTATVVAQTPMTLYVLSAHEFHTMLGLSPGIATKVAASVARRLRAYETTRPH